MRKIVQKELAGQQAGTPVIVYVVAERRARGLGGRLDLAGRRRARDGARDEHRLLDADHGRRLEHRQRPAPEDHQRRGRLAARSREDPRPQRRLGRQGRPGRVEPHRGRGAEDERDRPDLAEPAGAPEPDRRTARPSRCRPHAAHGGRRDHRHEPRLPHQVPLDAARPEPRSRCSSSPASPGSGSRSSIPASSCPARSARSRCCSRSSASRSCRSRGPASRSSCSARRCS